MAYIALPTGRVQNGKSPKPMILEADAFHRWTIPLGEWGAGMDGTNIGRIHVFTQRARRMNLEFLRVVLLKPDENPPPVDAEWRMKTRESRRAARHRAAQEDFRARCRAVGQSGDAFVVGSATAMENIRPRGDSMPRPAKAFRVRLARNEREAVQLFVLPDRDVRGVRVEASALKCDADVFPASDVHVGVVGYVETKRMPRHVIGTNRPCTENDIGYMRDFKFVEPGWWADPILDCLDRVDVKAGDLQGFWIRVAARKEIRPGIYRGFLRVTATGTIPRSFPFEVHVNGFTLPDRNPIKTAISFNPNCNFEFAKKHRAVLKDDPLAPINLWKRREDEWMSFLRDYRINYNVLYHWGKDGHPRFDRLKKLADEDRLDGFQLCCWDEPCPCFDEADKRKWKATVLPRIRRCLDGAKAAGIEKFAYLYGCDEAEPGRFPAMAWAVAELKKSFPGIPIFTSAYDHDFGVGTLLKDVDWFTPLTPKYDLEKAAAARAAGHEVWWYICCGPQTPYASMLTESPAIETRILVGAQAAKFRPDGFLHWSSSVWNSMRPISGTSAYTEWNAQSCPTCHGDGMWTCCGPDGIPLATIRLENFRDGLEDLAYVRALERRLADRPSVPWLEEARRLVAVPDRLTRDLKTFSTDPVVLYAWRDRMADLLDAK